MLELIMKKVLLIMKMINKQLNFYSYDLLTTFILFILKGNVNY